MLYILLVAILVVLLLIFDKLRKTPNPLQAQRVIKIENDFNRKIDILSDKILDLSLKDKPTDKQYERLNSQIKNLENNRDRIIESILKS